jgi:hypothetical protein
MWVKNQDKITSNPKITPVIVQITDTGITMSGVIVVPLALFIIF